MDMDNKYELLEVVANDAESKTFQAREAATGRPVYVHILFGGNIAPDKGKLLDLVLDRLVHAAPDKRRQILEVSDYKGMPYAVTEVAPDFVSLRQWLESDLGAGSPSLPPSTTRDRFASAGRWSVPSLEPRRPPQEPLTESGVFKTPAVPGGPAPPDRGGKEPGEFTLLFRAAVPEERTSPHGPQPPPPSGGTAGDAPRTAPVGPDEFERMFQPPQAPKTPAAEKTEPPQTGGPAAGPGEFTRLFQQSPAPPASTSPLPAGGPAPGPGEFTRLFQQSPAPPAAPPRPPSSAEPAHGPGEFTRLFQQPVAPTPPTPVTEPTAAHAEFSPPVPRMPASEPLTGLGEFPRVLQQEAQTPASAAPPSGGPGEFTRLFQQSPVESPRTGPPQPAAQPGEFTRLFHGSPPGGSESGGLGGVGGRTSPGQVPDPFARPVQSSGYPQAGAPGPSRPSPEDPDEFARFFGSSPGTGSPLPPAAPRAPSGGGATQMFSAPPVGAPPAAAASGPGEYTRMFGSPGASPPPAPAGQPAAGIAAPQQAQSATPRSATSYLPWLIIGNVLFLLLALVVMYFLLRK